MLEDPKYLESIHASGVTEIFVSEEARKAAQSIIEKYCQNPSDFDKLGASLMSHGVNSELLASHIALKAQSEVGRGRRTAIDPRLSQAM